LDAVWEPIVETEVSDLAAHFFVGRPGRWYLVTSSVDGDDYNVFAADGGTRTLLAQGVEPDIGLLRPYDLGFEELEDGHLATGVSWDGRALSLKRIDLDNAETELLDQVAVPGLSADVSVAEHLIGCGGVDALVASERQDGLTEYWVVRLLP
jgi:hypothetical protein